MVLRCGTLSQVHEDASKVVRPTKGGILRQGSTTSLNKRSRKPRTKDAFRTLTPKSSHDPLSLVGSEVNLVREYPLSVLERRGRYRKSSNTTSSRYRPQESCRPRYEELSVSDEADDESKLIQLQKIIYRNSDHPLSEGTKSSIRKRGLNVIGNIILSTSSNNSPENIHNTQQKIIQTIHGKNRASPACPNCSGQLTYLYISTKKSRISVCQTYNGDDTIEDKIKNLLPPLCINCKTHILYEHTKCRMLMMENFDRWLESGFDEASEGENDSQDGGYNFDDPKHAKMIVVSSTPVELLDQHDQRMAVHVSTSVEDPTPRLSNSSSRSERMEPSRFRFNDNELSLGENPMFSGLSSLSDGNYKQYRRKGQIQYEHIRIIDDQQEEQQNNGENAGESRQEVGDTVEALDRILSNIESAQNEAPSSNISAHYSQTKRHDGFSPNYYSSDDDPFSDLHDAQENDETDSEDDVEKSFSSQDHANQSKNGSCSGSAEGETDRHEENEVGDEENTCLSTQPQSLTNKSSGSLGLINTESEERKLMESYSAKKEIATKQIAKDLIRGHELTTSECDRCTMPMMKKDLETIDCVACPAIHRKAKRLARQKRRKKEPSKSNQTDVLISEERSCAVGDMIENRDDMEGNALSPEENSDQVDGTLEDQIIDTPSLSGYPLKKDSESLAILEETKQLNALEEGFLGPISSAQSGPFQFIGDCSETVNYGPSAEGLANNAPSWNQQYSTSSIGLNTINQSDYWVRHSSSHPNNASAQISAVLSSQSLNSSVQHRHSSSHPNDASSQISAVLSSQSLNSSVQCRQSAVEYSLSYYQGKTNQLNQPSASKSVNQLPPRCQSKCQESMLEASDYQGSLEASSTHNLPSGGMAFCQYQPNSSAALYHSGSNSVSEVSEYKESLMASDPTDKMAIHQSMPYMGTQAGDELDQHQSNQNEGLSSEVSYYSRSSEASSTRYPQNSPSSEKFHLQQQSYTAAVAEGHIFQNPSNQHEDSVLEQQWPCRAAVVAGHISQSLGSQYEGSASEVSEYHGSALASVTQGPSELPSSMTTIQHNQPCAKIGVEEQSKSFSSHFERSVSEVSQHQQLMATRSQQSHYFVPPSEINQHRESMSSEVSANQNFSEESLTQCPRNIPLNERIWHYASYDGSNQQVNHSQSSDETSQARNSQAHGTSLQQLKKVSPKASTQQLSAGMIDSDSWRDHPQETINEPQNVSSGDHDNSKSATDMGENSTGENSFSDIGSKLAPESNGAGHAIYELYADGRHSVDHCKESHDTHTIESGASYNSTNQFQGSISEVSENQRSWTAIATRSQQSVLFLPPAEKNQRQESISEVSVIQDFSDESSTRCPRNIPSNERIWNYESYDVSSQHGHASSSQSVDEPSHARNMHKTSLRQHDFLEKVNPEASMQQMSVGMINSDSWRDQPKETINESNDAGKGFEEPRNNPEPSSNDGRNSKDTQIGVGIGRRENGSDIGSKNAVETIGMSQTLSNLGADGANANQAHDCDLMLSIQNPDTSSSMRNQVQTPSRHLEDKQPHGRENDIVKDGITTRLSGSLSDKISQLADSLREVAKQMPKVDHSSFGAVPSENVETNGVFQIMMMANGKDQKGNANLSKSENEIHTYNDAPAPQDSAVQRRPPHLVPTPVLIEHTPRYEQAYSPLGRPRQLERRPFCSWGQNGQHDATMTSLRCRNGFGISISPITVGKSEKEFDLFHDSDENAYPSPKGTKACIYERQELSPHSSPTEHRADPPGRRMIFRDSERRDPPDNFPVSSLSDTKHESPRPNNSPKLLQNDRQAESPRVHGTKDPPPDGLAATHTNPSLPAHNGITPKSKGQRLRADNNSSTDKAISLAGTIKPHMGQIKSCATKADSNAICQLFQNSESSGDPYSPTNEMDPQLQTTRSWGDSSMDQLFKQIDEIEDDFNTIVASLPGSEGQVKSSASENGSLKSIGDKHSLVEITLNNVGSFESNTSEDSIMADVVQRMRRIKDYIERVDSLDEGGASHADDCDSQGEMAELMQRLTVAAESLRALNEWDD